MCGIAGYYGAGSKEILTEMGTSLTHRGPDAGGVIMIDSVGLAHRRLSVIDISKEGNQPMYDSSKRFSIVFNGEIFNFQELRKKYLAHIVFRGTSDTEVIVELFSKLGTEAFSLLQGMYAFAIYDNQTKELYLVRDSLGKKPLYYTQIGNTLVFGSELKALRKHPACPKALDNTSIAQYLLFEYIPAPRTIYDGVQKLPVGSCLVYDGKTIKQWNMKTDEAKAKYEVDTNPEKAFMDIMSESVKKRLVADVTVGVFLSGGLDSSVVAYFAQEQKKDKIKTFSVGFTDKSFDEQDDARLVASYLGTDHHDILLGVNEIRQVVQDLPQILDEPMADSSIVPTTLVSKFASDKVKVCLSGDGADELFHGYGTFYAHKWANRYRHVPSPLRNIVSATAKHIPVSHSYMSFDFKLKRFLSGVEVKQEHQNAIWLSAFTPEVIADISNNLIPVDNLFTQLDDWYAESEILADGLQKEYINGYLTEDILVKVDRASMWHGLEVRSPFLDEDMVNFALSLDEKYKLRGRTGKYLIKSAMSQYLPKQIVWKKKKGFNMPIGRLIIEDMKDEFATAILDGPLTKIGLLNRDKLVILMEQHWAGKRDYRKQIWSLYVLARWLDTWYE